MEYHLYFDSYATMHQIVVSDSWTHPVFAGLRDYLLRSVPWGSIDQVGGTATYQRVYTRNIPSSVVDDIITRLDAAIAFEISRELSQQMTGLREHLRLWGSGSRASDDESAQSAAEGDTATVLYWDGPPEPGICFADWPTWVEFGCRVVNRPRLDFHGRFLAAHRANELYKSATFCALMLQYLGYKVHLRQNPITGPIRSQLHDLWAILNMCLPWVISSALGSVDVPQRPRFWCDLDEILSADLGWRVRVVNRTSWTFDTRMYRDMHLEADRVRAHYELSDTCFWSANSLPEGEQITGGPRVLRRPRRIVAVVEEKHEA